MAASSRCWWEELEKVGKKVDVPGVNLVFRLFAAHVGGEKRGRKGGANKSPRSHPQKIPRNGARLVRQLPSHVIPPCTEPPTGSQSGIALHARIAGLSYMYICSSASGE